MAAKKTKPEFVADDAAKDRVQHESIHAAIAACAMEVPPIARETTGQQGNRQFSYATLPSAIRTIQPIMAKHGLAVVQPPVRRVIEGVEMAGCRTIILHRESGQSVEEEYLLPLSSQRDALMSFGATVSYVRRYTYPFFVPDDEHDHPEQGGGQRDERQQQPPSQPRQQRQQQAKPISVKQLNRLWAILGEKTDRDNELAKVILGEAKQAIGYAGEIKDLPWQMYDGLIQFIEDWREADLDPAPEDESQDPGPMFPDDLPDAEQEEVDRQFEEGLD